MRVVRLPRTPAAQRLDLWQVVLVSNLLQQEVRQRRRGLAQCESWVRCAVNQNHTPTCASKYPGQDAATETRPDNHDIGALQALGTPGLQFFWHQSSLRSKRCGLVVLSPANGS